MTTEPEPQIEPAPAAAAPAPAPTPVIRPGPDGGDRLPQMIERTRRRGRRRRAPVFTPQEVATIDYKDVDRLKKLLSDRGRIEPRRKTGLTAKDQRKIAREIKRARQVALLPYTAEHMRQTSRFRMVTRMAQRAMRAELDDAPLTEQAEAGAEQEAAAPAEPVMPEPTAQEDAAVVTQQSAAADTPSEEDAAVVSEESAATEAPAQEDAADVSEETVATEATVEPAATEEAESADAPDAAASEESGA